MATSQDKVTGLYALVDSTYVEPAGMKSTAERLLAGGVRLLQLRAKNLKGGELLRTAKALREVTRRHGALFIVNDRVDVAVLAGADGVHLGLEDIPVEEARKLTGPGVLIGASTHNPEEAEKAKDAGADYISFGPVFTTPTKKDARTPRGLAALREVRTASALPIVAIGGITEDDVAEVLRAGADSVAMISELLTAEDVTVKVRSVVSRMESVKG